VFGLRAHDTVVVGQLRTAEQIAQLGFGDYLGSAAQITFNSFWGQFGWMGVPMYTWAYAYALALLVLAALGWALMLWMSRRSARVSKPLANQKDGKSTKEAEENARQRPVQGDWLSGSRTASGLILALTGILAILAYLYYNTEIVQFQGRYQFPGF
jgi:hypothetical protein